MADPDEPISEDADDFIGREAVVASIVSAIVSDQTPVVALTGAYGDGKTSVLNLVRLALKEQQDVLAVPFSTWLPMGEEALVSTLLNSALETLQKRLFIPRIKRNLVESTQVLFAVLPGVPASVRDLFGKPSQSERIEELRRSLEKLPVRVAVLLDDMDRMHGNELNALLKLIRGVGEFPQFTYVCAFDRLALIETLRQSYSLDSAKAGLRFLEKFFPEEIPLPKIEESLIAAEFERRLFSICDRNGLLADSQERQEFTEYFRAIWQLYAKNYVSNLRRLKLLANRLGRFLPMVGHEVNLREFVLLELVRMMSPAMYEEIFRNARYFMFARWTSPTWPQVVSPDEQEELRRRNAYFDSLFRGLPKPPEGVLLGLLAEVFPTIRSYLTGIDLRAQGLRSSAEREHRACHPDYFPRYFIFRAPYDMFGEMELSTFISAMNSKDDLGKCARQFRSTYTAFSDVPQMKRWDFLRRVDLSIDQFTPLAMRSLPIAIAELSGHFDGSAPGMIESTEARKIVFDSVKRTRMPSECQDLIEDVIRRSQSDCFAAEVLNDSNRETPGVEDTYAIDTTKMEGAFRERMEARYGKGGGLTFFPEKGQADFVPLGRWGLCGQQGREQVERYLRREFEVRHSNVGSFLLRFFPGGEASDDPREWDPVATIERIYFPPEELLALLDAYGDSAFSSDDEARAIGEFKAHMLARAPRTGPDLPANEV